jgi:hypothetical protein
MGMGQRTIRVGELDTPETLAKAGGGEVIDLWDANKGWLTPGITDYPGRATAFKQWNIGQQMFVPPRWRSLRNEYEGPKL